MLNAVEAELENTKLVAEFVAGTRYEQIPAAAVDSAKEAILDSLGVALAGSRDPAGRICAEVAREEGAKEEAAVFGQGFRSSALMAAFANGTAMHAMDYDASFSILGQPTAALAPAVFALSEPLAASGRRLLEAYVVGFEVTAKLAWSLSSMWSEGGSWHAVGILGSLGSAAASARLLDLDPDEVCAALGIATSMASGVVWNFGTMTKPLHAGLAARNGLLAAKLAKKGFSANRGILEGARGFFESYGVGSSQNLTPWQDLGSSFEVDGGVKFKAYPCGGLTHAAIDAVLALRKEHQIDADAIEEIEVKVTSAIAKRIVYRIPQTGLQAKFSMPYILATAALRGGVAPNAFDDDAVRDPRVLALADRVRMEVDPRLQATAGGGQPSAVSIRLRDGSSLHRAVDHPRGSTQSPMSGEELRAKFADCARRALGEREIAEAADAIDHLETLESLAPLSKLLMGTPTRVP